MTQGNHRTLVAIGFIAATAVVAVLLALKPTVARGAALADIVFESHAREGARYECDDNVPIEGDLTIFQCRSFGVEGIRTTYEIRMDRAGTFEARVLDTSLPGL